MRERQRIAVGAAFLACGLALACFAAAAGSILAGGAQGASLLAIVFSDPQRGWPIAPLFLVAAGMAALGLGVLIAYLVGSARADMRKWGGIAGIMEWLGISDGDDDFEDDFSEDGEDDPE